MVLGLQPAPDADIAELFRDDDVWGSLTEAVAPLFHPDFACVQRWLDAAPTTYPGLDGLRTAWLDWLEPWVTYRTEIKEAIDYGDRVLVLVHDFARREGSTEEVMLVGAAVWTVDDGKIIRAQFYTDRTQALKAVVLEE